MPHFQSRDLGDALFEVPLVQHPVQVDGRPRTHQPFFFFELALNRIDHARCRRRQGHGLPAQCQLAPHHLFGGNHQPAIGLAHHLLDAILSTVHGALGLIGLVGAQVDTAVLHVFHDGLPCQIGSHSISQALHGITIGRQENQAVAFQPWRIAPLFQHLGGSQQGQRLILLAVTRIGRQHHQTRPQAKVIGHVGRRRKHMDARKVVALGKHPAHAVAQQRHHVVSVFQVGLAAFHFAAQVGARVKPVAILFTVEVMQPITQALDDVLIRAHSLPRLHGTQQDAIHPNASYRLRSVRWRTAQEDGARHAPRGLQAAKPGVVPVNVCRR